MASKVDDERYCFLVEWYEAMAARIRQFQFFYFVNLRAVEMYDINTQKRFLCTTLKENDISVADLYIGNSITLCGRLLSLVDYGDEYTRRKLGAQKQRTLGLLKPDAADKFGHVLDIITQTGALRVTRLRMCRLNREQAMVLYKQHAGERYLNTLLEYIASGPVVAMELVGENAVEAWKKMMGPGAPVDARKEAPASIRALYGKDNMYNAVHGSDCPEEAAREIEFFFPSSGPMLSNTATVKNCTCCIIKPTALKAGLAGKIVMAIMAAGFRVGAAQLVTLEKANAEEFLEVYKGVVHEYPHMVEELVSGPFLAMEITGPDDGPPVGPAFRQLVGPADPEIARQLRPKTLRALFGKDKGNNAIHCTDLPDDCQLEVEYFFRVLDR